MTDNQQEVYMLQDLLTLYPQIPEDSMRAATVSAIMLGLLGVSLWLFGSRFSRHIVTLTAVACGALAGRQIPGWMGWDMSTAATTVAAAVCGGVIGFLLHRFWIGVGLGLVMALWAFLGSWVLLRSGQSWSWPSFDADTTIAGFATELWRVLPEDVTRVAPFSSGLALLTGIGASIMFPRLAVVLTWSLAGVSLLTATGLGVVEIGRPQWTSALPAQTWSQLGTFAGLVLFGALVQWKLASPGAVRVTVKGATCFDQRHN